MKWNIDQKNKLLGKWIQTAWPLPMFIIKQCVETIIFFSGVKKMKKDDDVLNLHKKELAFYALYGLTMSIIDPLSKGIFVEAHRAIFDRESVELKQLAELMNSDPASIQEDIFSFLSAAGVPCDSTLKH